MGQALSPADSGSSPHPAFHPRKPMRYRRGAAHLGSESPLGSWLSSRPAGRCREPAASGTSRTRFFTPVATDVPPPMAGEKVALYYDLSNSARAATNSGRSGGACFSVPAGGKAGYTAARSFPMPRDRRRDATALASPLRLAAMWGRMVGVPSGSGRLAIGLPGHAVNPRLRDLAEPRASPLYQGAALKL